MKNEHNQCLITDIDNTLCNWVSFHAKRIRFMVHFISDKFSIDELTIMSQIKALYTKHSTMEFQNIIENLPCLDEVPDEIKHKTIMSLSRIIGRNSWEWIKPYKGVTETLKEIKFRNHNNLIIAVTNAPKAEAIIRLRYLKIAKYFDGLFCWSGAIMDPEEKSLHSRSGKTPIPYIYTVDKSGLKPAPDLYMRVLEEFSLHQSQCVVIGDSIEKDLIPAKNLGIKTFWAKFGEVMHDRDLQTIIDLTPWTKREVERSLKVEGHPELRPDNVADSYEKVLSFFNYGQSSIFDSK